MQHSPVRIKTAAGCYPPSLQPSPCEGEEAGRATLGTAAWCRLSAWRARPAERGLSAEQTLRPSWRDVNLVRRAAIRLGLRQEQAQGREFVAASRAQPVATWGRKMPD
jgi:hypothetical protein